MKIVRSILLSTFPEVLFGMSTNTGGIHSDTMGLNLSFNVGDHPEQVQANRNAFFTALGVPGDRIAFTQQEHTVNIASVTMPGTCEHCDALVTDRTDLFLAISIADCTPLILYDPVRHCIAGIHAGWRGTAGRIVSRTIEKIVSEYGTDPRDLVAFIGPSAGKCCYEVGREVAEQFDERSSVQKADGKFMLDVKHANMLQLLESGVRNTNIEVHSDCSIHDPLYHSHRRDGKRSGRMLAVIGKTY